ncbi:transcriptional regulator [Mycobacterium botniense]|uniref:Transcriptional regulator n=1 Tax=Mycobacterium botniense TaxID=84962 RepID=A0A7I9Y2I2_9MYCO|nr:transcriptional regulator [Mycobacterium botniense]
MLKAASSPMSIAAIADELRVHPNTVRFHLENLVGEALVEQVAPDQKRPGRPPQLFRAIAQMDPRGPRRYRLLAEILVMSLAGERNSRTKALAAGRAWGRRLPAPTIAGRHARKVGSQAALNHLVRALEELGFAPERRRSGREKQIGLRHCPFLELAELQSGVVCPIHLGIMQGALHTWNAPFTVDRLDPLVEPDLCLAHLRPLRTTR